MSDYTDGYNVTHEADMDHDNKWMAAEIERLSSEGEIMRKAVDKFLDYFEACPMDLCWDDDATRDFRAAVLTKQNLQEK